MSLSVTCGALALCILLIANATKDAREQWFFDGLYAVVGGTLGVILSGRVEGAIMDKMKTSFLWLDSDASGWLLEEC